jgi:hypothetical protein
MELSKEYVLEHTAQIQDYDSFGRNLALALLQAAALKLEHGGPKESVEIKGHFVLTAFGLECMTIQFEADDFPGLAKAFPKLFPLPPFHVGNR